MVDEPDDDVPRERQQEVPPNPRERPQEVPPSGWEIPIPQSGSRQPPPSGWEIPHSGSRQPPPERDPLAQVLAALRRAIPDEVQVAAVDLVRALLEALLAVLDWLASIIQRNGAAGEPDVQVHDIPIL